jgi:MinD superfamily P-loop ATPase
MKEIVIISGKGGTGKTSVCASFAALASKKQKIVFTDCDVDAADLHLIFSPEVRRTEGFISGHEAHIDIAQCAQCGKCTTLCKFDAIVYTQKRGYSVEPSSCEGCGVCVKFCPSHAISFNKRNCGEWYVFGTRFGTLVHAQLDAHAENSGKLVTVVRKEASRIAAEQNAVFIITDGPPGTGCPVIASITGAHAVVAVTEPTLSGKHDLERVMELTRHFHVPMYVCVNKWDINPEISAQIQRSCKKNNAEYIGKISFSRSVTAAQIQGMSVIEYSNNKTAKEIKVIWKRLLRKMKRKTRMLFLKNVWRKLRTK